MLLKTDWQDRLCRMIRGRILRKQAAMIPPETRRSIRRLLGMGCTGESLSRAAQRVDATCAVRVWAYLRVLGRI